MVPAGPWREAVHPDGEAQPCDFSAVPLPHIESSRVHPQRSPSSLGQAGLSSGTSKVSDTGPKPLVLTAPQNLLHKSEAPDQDRAALTLPSHPWVVPTGPGL